MNTKTYYSCSYETVERQSRRNKGLPSILRGPLGVIITRRRGRLKPAQVVLQLVDVVEGRAVRGLVLGGDGLKVDVVLEEQGLVLAQAFDEIPLVGLLLPPPRRLRRDHAALNPGLDAVCTWFVLITTNLALLTQNT